MSNNRQACAECNRCQVSLEEAFVRLRKSYYCTDCVADAPELLSLLICGDGHISESPPYSTSAILTATTRRSIIPVSILAFPLLCIFGGLANGVWGVVGGIVIFAICFTPACLLSIFAAYLGYQYRRYRVVYEDGDIQVWIGHKTLFNAAITECRWEMGDSSAMRLVTTYVIPRRSVILIRPPRRLHFRFVVPVGHSRGSEFIWRHILGLFGISEYAT